MQEHTQTSEHEPHGQTLSTGIVLVNLGTPENPDTAAVRRYLAEFLMDPRVVEQPRWIWWIILHGIILRLRPKRSAEAYKKVWTPQGSPLMVHSEAQRDGLIQAIGTAPVQIRLAMRYGKPSISDALDDLRRHWLDRLLIVPLYPQYSATTTASVFDAVHQTLSRWRWIPELRLVSSYHDHPTYIKAVASSINRHWREVGCGQHLLFSFHGIPVRYVKAGDPYHCQCQKSARLIAQALELEDQDWSVSFQSRVGREPWLPPYTDETLKALPGRGVKQVDVVCPGFSVDCLETLEEIAMEGQSQFLEAGGERLNYIPALNASEDGIDLLVKLVQEHGCGWPGLSESAAPPRQAGTPEVRNF